MPCALIPLEDGFQEQVVVEGGDGDVMAKRPNKVVVESRRSRREPESIPHEDINTHLQLQKLSYSTVVPRLNSGTFVLYFSE